MFLRRLILDWCISKANIARSAPFMPFAATGYDTKTLCFDRGWCVEIRRTLVDCFNEGTKTFGSASHSHISCI